jgi:ATP-dependent exoDNAse (exonuclease V) beta subunit
MTLEEAIRRCYELYYERNDEEHRQLAEWLEELKRMKTVSEQIIRKKAEVSDYWLNDVKQYRAMQGYSDIEHDADNFLRGYNEAVEDMLSILDGTPNERGGEQG